MLLWRGELDVKKARNSRSHNSLLVIMMLRESFNYIHFNVVDEGLGEWINCISGAMGIVYEFEKSFLEGEFGHYTSIKLHGGGGHEIFCKRCCGG